MLGWGTSQAPSRGRSPEAWLGSGTQIPCAGEALLGYWGAVGGVEDSTGPWQGQAVFALLRGGLAKPGLLQEQGIHELICAGGEATASEGEVVSSSPGGVEDWGTFYPDSWSSSGGVCSVLLRRVLFQ